MIQRGSLHFDQEFFAFIEFGHIHFFDSGRVVHFAYSEAAP
jgi:hypothetical protein